MQQYESSLVDVALAAAGRIVMGELAQDPNLIVRWAQQAVYNARTASQLTVAVHPETLAELGPAFDEMLSAPDLPENTQVVPDPSVGPTEVVVRQSGGEIRAGLMSQLDRLQESLQ